MHTDAVEIAVTVFLAHKGKEDEVIRGNLAALGLEAWLVDALVLWLPIAFGRELLSDVNFSDSYSTEEGDDKAFPLNEETVYLAAVRRAQRMNRDEASAIATRSAEVTLISEYLNTDKSSGATLELADVPPPQLQFPTRPPKAPAGDGGATEPRSLLASLLRANGLEVGVPDEEGMHRAGDLRFGAMVYPTGKAPMQAQVDYVIQHPALAAGTIVESNAAVGSTWSDGVELSMKNFVRSSLRPLLGNLLASNLAGEDVTWEDWAHRTGSYRVCVGPHLFTGTDPVAIGALLDTLRVTFSEARLPRAVHVVRFYTGRQNGRTVGEEVLLNGELWEAGREALETFPWPIRKDFYSSRLFLVLRPAE